MRLNARTSLRSILLSFSVALALLSGCAKEATEPNAGATRTDESAPRSSIVIAEGTQPVAAPVYVAFERGFWKELGLDVQLVPFTSGRLCLDAVLSGKANAGTMAETPIMHAGFSGAPITVITQIHHSDKNTKVIARKDKGVKKPADLRNRKVAVSVGTNGEFFMDQYLKRNALARSDVQVINLRPEDMAPSVIRGDVDAAFTWEPHIHNALQTLSDKAVIFPNDGVYRETYNIVTTRDYAKSHRRELDLLLRGLAKAVEFIHQNPQESASIVSRRIKMDSRVLSSIWQDYTFRLELDQSLLNLLNAEAQWSKSAGITEPSTPIPDYRQMIDAEPLRALQPAAVTIQ